MDKTIMSPRTASYFIRNLFNYTLNDVSDYFSDNCSSIDVLKIKDGFIELTYYDCDLEYVLTQFILNLIKTKSEEIPEVDDLKTVIKENIDLFFDISQTDNDVVYLEIA